MDSKHPQPRQHHLVPKSLLRRFAKNEKVQVLDFQKTESRSDADIKTVLRIRDFFAFRMPDGRDDVSIEAKLLQELESRVKPVIDTMIRTAYAPDTAAWGVLAQFIASLHLRTVQFRQGNWEIEQLLNHFVARTLLESAEGFTNVLQDLLNGVESEVPVPEASARGQGLGVCKLIGPQRDFVRYLLAKSEGTPLTLERARTLYKNHGYTTDVPQNEFLYTIVHMLPWLTEIVREMTPRLLFAPGKCQFVIGDNPVVLDNPKESSSLRGTTGWLCEGVRAFLPLDSKCCLLLDWKGDEEPLAVPDQFVGYLNVLQALNCSRYVIARDLSFGWLRKGSRTIAWNPQELMTELQQIKQGQHLVSMSFPPGEWEPPEFSVNKVRRTARERNTSQS